MKKWLTLAYVVNANNIFQIKAKAIRPEEKVSTFCYLPLPHVEKNHLQNILPLLHHLDPPPTAGADSQCY